MGVTKMGRHKLSGFEKELRELEPKILKIKDIDQYAVRTNQGRTTEEEKLENRRYIKIKKNR